jgi:hypothetical protein
MTPSRKAAVLKAHALAREIVAGIISPIDGASRIYWECFDYDAHNTGDEAVDAIGWFGGLADEWEEVQDVADARQKADARILDAAREYLQNDG